MRALPGCQTRGVSIGISVAAAIMTAGLLGTSSKMIIDAHIHVFPDQGGSGLGRSRDAQHAMMQSTVGDFWGRMVTSHKDRRFIPDPEEDVQFAVADFGRWTWKKHGEDCWLQRGSPMMTRMQHTPAQAIAAMDAAGVDFGVIQTDIEYLAADFGRERYFRDCIAESGDRLIATVPLDYHLSHDDVFLTQERAAVSEALEHGFRGVYVSGQGLPEPLDDPRCDVLWRELSERGVPVYIQTGFCPRDRYHEQLRGLLRVLRSHPGLQVIESHLGGNLVHQEHPDYTDILEDLGPLLSTGQFYLELGYVLGFENYDLWGENAIYPFPGHTDIARTVYERFGAGVLVWGSDVPWCYRVCTYQQTVDLVRYHTPYMSREDRGTVLGGNLARLFGLA